MTRSKTAFISSLWIIGLSLTLSACSNNSARKNSAENNISQRAETLVSQMTLEEKIGQVIQADISAVTPEDLTRYNLGSVLNGGNSAPGGGVIAPVEDWIALADAYWLASTDKSDGGVGIPAIWGTDAVHGHNNLQSATIFPHNSALGAMNNPDLMKKVGAVTAAEIRATGLDWTFAPTIAVARDDRWGRAYESYSENPEIVVNYARAMVDGLQGKPGTPGFLKGAHVAATAKHFIADGGTQYGIDKGDAVGERAEIIEIHGAGFRSAIDAGVQSVMSSFSSINGDKMHGSHYYLTELLRDEMGFTGFVVGDWNGHGEVPGCTATDCPAALEAGIDMYMAPDSWRGLYDNLLAQAKSGELDLARLDQAVTRILKVKIRSGLLDAGLPSERVSTRPEMLGAPAHRKIARQAVRESLVLLKNENGALPVKPARNILVTGSGGHSMQQQTGGWTLSWQGDNNSNDVFEGGATIFEGIALTARTHGSTAVYSPNGEFKTKPDIAFVVFGEQPYAEYRGDRSDLVYEFEDGANLELIKKLKAQDITVVSIFLTGRPLWVNPHLNASDAFVVAWLPGTEGGGVADVVMTDSYGKAHHDFKGRLSFSWPSNGAGKPINMAKSADIAAGVLYPLGYGLTYKSPKGFETLSENPGITNVSDAFDGGLIVRGDAASGLTFVLGDTSNQNVPVSGLAAESLGGAVSSKGTDYKAQEDARRLSWAGTGEGSAALRTQRAIDLTQFGNPDNMVLSLLWNINYDPVEVITVAMGCGDGCLGEVELNEIVPNVTKNQWIETEIPVSCLTASGLDPEKVTTALKLSSADEIDISIHEARLIVEDRAVPCP